MKNINVIIKITLKNRTGNSGRKSYKFDKGKNEGTTVSWKKKMAGIKIKCIHNIYK